LSSKQFASILFVFRRVQVMHWTPADYLETGLVFAFHVGYRWILPFACLPFWHALAIFMVAEVSASLGFVLQFVVNHEVCGQSVQGKAGHAPFVPQGLFKNVFVSYRRFVLTTGSFSWPQSVALLPRLAFAVRHDACSVVFVVAALTIEHHFTSAYCFAGFIAASSARARLLACAG
jgi:hypothetical protein